MNKTLALMVKEGNLKEVKKLFPKSSSKARPGDWTTEQATETVDRRGQNILHLAVEANRIDIVRFLIEGQSMNPNTLDKSGWTPLHIACAAGNLEMIEYLVVRVGATTNIASVDSSTPLHYFVRHVPAEGATASAHPTPRRQRHEIGQADARKSLFGLRRMRSDEEFGLGNNASGGGGVGRDDTYFRVLEALLNKRGRESLVNAKNKNGDTPLHIAATRGNALVLNFLLQRNANPNATNVFGETSLHMAVRAGMEQAVNLLVDAGVDVTISAPNTGTARDIAVANEAKLIADLLDARVNAIATAARQSASIPIPTKGDSVVKILERSEAIAATKGDKEEALSVVRVHNPTFSLNLPRNLHNKVGESDMNRQKRSSVGARRLVEQTPARRFVVITSPDVRIAKNLARYSSPCLQHTRTAPKAPLFTRPSYTDDSLRPQDQPLAYEKCVTSSVTGAAAPQEPPTIKKTDSLSRLFALMQPSSSNSSSDKGEGPPVASVDKFASPPEHSLEQFQARREELILRLRKRAFALSEMELEMTRRASFRARTITGSRPTNKRRSVVAPRVGAMVVGHLKNKNPATSSVSASTPTQAAAVLASTSSSPSLPPLPELGVQVMLRLKYPTLTAAAAAVARTQAAGAVTAPTPTPAQESDGVAESPPAPVDMQPASSASSPPEPASTTAQRVPALIGSGSFVIGLRGSRSSGKWASGRVSVPSLPAAAASNESGSGCSSSDELATPPESPRGPFLSQRRRQGTIVKPNLPVAEMKSSDGTDAESSSSSSSDSDDDAEAEMEMELDGVEKEDIEAEKEDDEAELVMEMEKEDVAEKEDDNESEEDDDGDEDELLGDEYGDDENGGYISCMADAQQELIAYEQELRAKQRGTKKEIVPPGGNTAGERKGIKRLLERRSMDFSSSPRKSRGTEAHAPLLSTRNTEWAASFAAILDALRSNDVEEGSEDMLMAYSSLVQLTTDFTTTVRPFAKTIISELNFPAAQKTIKPLSTCVTSSEFMAHGILFQVASSSSSLVSTTEGSARVIGHDMRALMHMVRCVVEDKIQDIYFPLVCTVDFRGFRVYATSRPSELKGDVVYGPSASGSARPVWNRAVHKKLKRICRRLNLQPYIAGSPERPIKFYTPIELVVTRESDGRLYLSNCARLFPCEQPQLDDKSARLVRQLRPEFVRKYTHPLCSQAYNLDEDAAPGAFEQQIDEATAHLKNVVIPDFAREMDSWDVSLYSSQFLTSSLHWRGINVRYMGLVDLLNLTLGVGEDAELFWKEDMLPLLESKFEGFMAAESSPDFNLKHYVVFPHADVKGETDGRPWIYQNVNESVGVRWVKASKKLFLSNARAFDADYPLDDADFSRLMDRVESLPLSLYAQGYLMYRKATFKAEGERQDKEARHFYLLAIDYFKRALRQGYGTANLFTFLADSHVALNQLEKADMCYASAVAASKQDPRVLLKYAIFLERCNFVEQAEDTYLLALTKDKDPRSQILCTYADFLFAHLGAYVDAHHLYLAAIKTLNPLPSACNNYACMSLKMANELLMSQQPGEGTKQKREELVERARVYFELALRIDPKHPQHLRNFGLFLKQHFSNEHTVCVSGRFLTADELIGRAGQEEKEREQRAREGLQVSS